MTTMKDIPGFKIDKWVQRYSPSGKVSLHGSNIGTMSLSELQKLAPDEQLIDTELQLGYGNAAGSIKLRERIAAMYSSPDSGVTLTADNVVVAPGSSMANFLALTNIAGPGDHIICQYPTFSQLFLIPKFNGAEVSLWKLKRGPGGWESSLDELKGMVKENTKVIIINNPNNPTGAILPLSTLHSLVALAAEHNIILYSDEVFRPLFHSINNKNPTPPPSLLALNYPRTIVTGSVSKTIGLPGVRVGWVVSPDIAFLQDRVMTVRDYTTIAVSQLDESVASFALAPPVLSSILERSLGICARSIATLGEFVARNPGRVEWTPPAGAGTAFIRILGRDGKPVDDAVFAKRLVEEAGVSVVPGGYCFGEPEGEDIELKGYLRIALGPSEEKLRDGLQRLEKFLEIFE